MAVKKIPRPAQVPNKPTVPTAKPRPPKPRQIKRFQPAAAPSLLVSLVDTANTLSVSVMSVRRLIAAGTLPTGLIGHRRLARRADVEHLAARGTPSPWAARPARATEQGQGGP